MRVFRFLGLLCFVLLSACSRDHYLCPLDVGGVRCLSQMQAYQRSLVKAPFQKVLVVSYLAFSAWGSALCPQSSSSSSALRAPPLLPT